MEVKVTFEGSAFVVEAEGKKLRISYKEKLSPYAEAMKFCKENGGGDETVENLRFLAKHRDAINKQLVAESRSVLSNWYWSNEVSWRYGNGAFVVNSYDGLVCDYGMYRSINVRAVSAL